MPVRPVAEPLNSRDVPALERLLVRVMSSFGAAGQDVRVAVGVVVADRDGRAQGVAGLGGAGDAGGGLVDDLGAGGGEARARGAVDGGDLAARVRAGLGGVGLADDDVVDAVAVDVAAWRRRGRPSR